MIGIIDYGVGNLFSLCSSCKAIGEEAFVSGDATELAKADRLILPGVGAFEDAAKKLRGTGMADFVRQQAAQGKPLLGICLGMQLLFERSYEYGCQFHPEKSGNVGLNILRKFAEVCTCTFILPSTCTAARPCGFLRAITPR